MTALSHLLPHFDMEKEFVDVYYTLFKGKKVKDDRGKLNEPAKNQIDYIRKRWLILTYHASSFMCVAKNLRPLLT